MSFRNPSSMKSSMSSFKFWKYVEIHLIHKAFAHCKSVVFYPSNRLLSCILANSLGFFFILNALLYLASNFLNSSITDKFCLSGVQIYKPCLFDDFFIICLKVLSLLECVLKQWEDKLFILTWAGASRVQLLHLPFNNWHSNAKRKTPRKCQMDIVDFVDNDFFLISCCTCSVDHLRSVWSSHHRKCQY